MSFGSNTLGLGEIEDIFFRRRVKIDLALGVAGTDRDLLHVAVGRVEQRACFGQRQRCNRARHVGSAKVGAFERVDRDVDHRAVPVDNPFADEADRRFVEFAFADHHSAIDWKIVELSPHRVDGSLRSAAKTWRRIASTSDIRVAAAAPTQSASVETSRSTPSRW